MSDVVIRAERLGKRYTIGHEVKRERYTALRDVLARGGRTVLRKAGDLMRGRPMIQGDELEEVWALRDVSFEVTRGEVVGLIGRNGAGKSTLLKILSRITDPSAGRATMKGRVASLLEVGTGFHPELTGRENIFLNGAILGMTRSEIERKFDEIVAFAEVDRFLDTPVKHYSSGMYLRLAFAVAAHLEPEILLVDEVLAVGDAVFQRKCLGKMGDVAREGRTVLLVSHNMGAIQQLCKRVLLIRNGTLAQQGSPDDVIAGYLSEAVRSENGVVDFSDYAGRAANCTPMIRSLTLRSSSGVQATLFYPDEEFSVEIFIDPPRLLRSPRVALSIEDHLGRRILTAASFFHGHQLPDMENPCRITCSLPRLALGSGHYFISVSVGTKIDGWLDWLESVVSFEVGWRDNYENGEPYYKEYGPVLTKSSWEYSHEENPRQAFVL